MPVLRAQTPWVSVRSPKEPIVLFDTVPIKMCCGLLLLTYYVLLVWICHLASSSLLTAPEYRFSIGFALFSLLCLFFASFGLRFSRASCLVPLLILQAVVLFFFFFIYGHATYTLVSKHTNNWSKSRLCLVLMYEILLLGLHAYCMYIVFTCINYFNKRVIPSAKTPVRHSTIPQFIRELDECLEDTVVFEKTQGAQKKMQKPRATSFTNPIIEEKPSNPEAV